MAKQPSLYISHGGGPCFWIEFPTPVGPHAFDNLRTFLAGVLSTVPARPNAILVASGHWEEAVTTFGSGTNPEMIYDYYGFPPHTYKLNYPAPGAPAVAAQALELLEKAGIKGALDPSRGFDHGIFVPFLIADPNASIPIVPMSLRRDLNAKEHLRVGAALAPLREKNILIVGSGNSYHNLRDFFDGEERSSAQFDNWLVGAATDPNSLRRNDLLANWASAPAARDSHPREEHLIPLMVAAGAGLDDRGRRIFSDKIAGKAISGFAFG